MSKGHFTGSIRLFGAVAVVMTAAWVGCNGWQGLTPERSNLVSPNGAVTQAGDEARTSWYPDQPGLDPAIVGGPNFKRLFKTTLPLTPGEQTLAQPLVVNGNVLVVTEANNVYLLDGATGAITASRALGAAYNASAGLGCGDIQPTVGVTGTPVVDTSSNTAYFFSKSSAGAFTLHALDAGTLAERAGFPVTIAGTAQNDATVTFDSVHEHQRPGLLLMGGVVYGAFAAHCDIGSYRGWIVGVSTAGALKTMFTTEANTTGHGAGIWMSGSGLASDGAGQILFATGNGYTPNLYPAPIPSNTPPTWLEESVARVVVQGDGSLKATDWFSPYNAPQLGDTDVAAGGIVALPSQFGTAAFPHLAALSGKGGFFYLFNRDKLGGYQQGPAGGDAVLGTVTLDGGTWSHPAVWPGDGGYVFVMVNGSANGGPGFHLQVLKYGTNGAGAPAFTAVSSPADNFGGYSGSPIVTSNGTASGSALVWVVSNTAQLRVYKIAATGALTSVFTDSVGSEAKFTTVGVGSGRVYVGSADGNVFGYGAGTAAVTGAALDFGTVVVGQTKTLTATLTANQNLTIPAGGLTSTNAAFTLGASTPGLPVTLAANATLTVPVTFKPTASGSASAALNVAVTGGGGGSVTLSGLGQVNAPQLAVSPVMLSFGGVATGTSKALTVLLQNTGNQTLTFSGFTAPAAPYSVTGVPANGATLAAGATVTATVTFAPTAAGTSSSTLVVTSNGGNVTIPLSGTSGAPPQMVITPLSLDFGTIATGASSTMSFTIQNKGGTDLQITKSKPPALGAFDATTTLAEGSVITAGQTVTESVTFSSSTGGAFSDIWVITGNDTSGVQNVAFTGTVAAPLSRAGWVASASNTGGADVPANALDGSLASRWTTGAVMAAGMWFQVDTGAAQQVSEIVMDSNGTGDYARSYSVYVTNDPTNLGASVASGTATATPITVPFAAKTGRYIRVVLGTIPAGTTAWWSIQEFNVYGSGGASTGAGGSTGTAGAGGSTGTAGAGGSTGAGGAAGSGAALSRAGWAASASNTGGGDVPANALDGSLASRWSTGAVMAAGMWFQVDMGADNSVTQIVMDSNGTGDYARAYSVYVTDSTTNLGTAVASGTATATPITVPFAAKTGRYIRVVLGTIPAGTTAWWSIQEFTASGTAGGGGAGGATGSTGTAGTTGSAGSSGAAGTAGAAGTSGTAGAGGTNGTAPGAAYPRTGWIASATVVGGADIAANAIDGNAATRFSTGTAQVATGQQFQVDMLTPLTFNQITMDSGGDFARGYQVFVSTDGTNFGTAIATGTATANPVTVTFPAQTARYVRVVQTSNTAASWWSIYELNVYAAGNLARTGWTATASSTGGTDVTANALDGVAATRWSAGATQANGQWFLLDMQSNQTFKQVTLDANGTTDYPHGYQLFVSTDGVNFGAAIATGTPTTSLVTITFPTQTARYIKIVQTGTATSWWSIYELNVSN